MRFNSLLLTAALTVVLAVAADHPAFSGIWLLDTEQSTGNVPAWASMSVLQTGHHFRMAQNDRDGRVVRSFEGECKTDGRFHPVQGGDGGSIECKWDGTTLETQQHWNDNHNQRVVRTMFSPGGNLIQELHEASPDGTKDAHLVWKRQ